jgi:hypothetical protein
MDTAGASDRQWAATTGLGGLGATLGGGAMNRWRQRFAELRGDSAKPPASSSAVQFVQNVQNLRTPAPKSAFEHFEQIEQPTKPREAPVLT